MPTPRDILELLSRSELLWLADLFRVQLPERLRKEPIVNALASTPGARLDEMLLRLSRDRLEVMAKLVPGYLPTVQQLTETRKLDIAWVRKRSASFDKLVRVLADVSGTVPPAR